MVPARLLPCFRSSVECEMMLMLTMTRVKHQALFLMALSEVILVTFAAHCEAMVLE